MKLYELSEIRKNFAIAQQFDKLANYMNYPLTIHLYMIYLISTGVYDLSCIQFICPQDVNKLTYVPR